MPLFDYQCHACGQSSEILILGRADEVECAVCGSRRMTKKISAPSSMSGSVKPKMPGPGDTGCCGSSPGEASGCAGPGSCCGKVF
jgi:putative FmdB family regulatory protein